MKCSHCGKPIEKGHEFGDEKHTFHARCWKYLHTKRKDFQYVRDAQKFGCPSCQHEVGDYDWFFSKATDAYYHLRCGKPFHETKLIGGPK